jgi:hypothetical protein
MAYKLAIEDVIGVKIEGKNQGRDGTERPFKFILVCERYSADQMKSVVSDKEETAFAFFEKVARDWQNQKLVLDEEGAPAPFNTDSLRMLLSISGMAMLCWQAYLVQVQAAAKN